MLLLQFGNFLGTNLGMLRDLLGMALKGGPELGLKRLNLLAVLG